MPVIIKELVLRIHAEQPPASPAYSEDRLPPGLATDDGPQDDATIREAVAQTLRILREKKER